MLASKVCHSGSVALAHHRVAGARPPASAAISRNGNCTGNACTSTGARALRKPSSRASLRRGIAAAAYSRPEEGMNDAFMQAALVAFPELANSAAPLTVVGSGAIANNAGGVLKFNLTTEQTWFEARIWPSDSLRVTPGTVIAPAARANEQSLPFLRLVVTREDMTPHAKLFLHTKEQPDGAEVPVDVQPAARIGPAAVDGAPVPHSRTYWLSFDRMNWRIKYGRGYHMESTTEKVWTLPKPEKKDAGEASSTEKALSKLFGFGVKMACLAVDKVVQQEDPTLDGVAATAPTIAFDPLPLVVDRPAKVLDSSLVTLADMDSARFLFSADLPPACRVLYDNVTGANVTLDDQLVAAIAHSIETPGKALYKKLAEKPKDFGYLRVVLGEQLGDGPGVPYVLEIWPGGSRSPIHNHGNVCAVIKVLHGSIHVDIHNKLEAPEATREDPSVHPDDELEKNPPPVLKTMRLDKGDVTWMDANWFQCHRLRNTNPSRGQFCATIQCYKYDDRDSVKWPGFDYLEDGRDGVFLFEPEKDFTYGEMRDIVLREMREG